MLKVNLLFVCWENWGYGKEKGKS